MGRVARSSARRMPAPLVLVLALVAAAPVIAQFPPDVIAANRAATDAYNKKQWSEAIRLNDELEGLVRAALASDPNNGDLLNLRSVTPYNSACCAALAGNAVDAFARLRRAIDAGMLDRRYFATDTDLDLLRSDATRWAEVLAHLEREIRRLEGDAKPGVIILPPGADPAAPIRGIVAFHGGGGSVESVEQVWRSVVLEVKMAVILVRGSQIYGYQSFGYNQPDTSAEFDRVEEWIARAKQQVPGLDTDTLIVSGYSQGGGLAALLALERPRRRFAGMLLVSPYVQVAQRERVIRPRFLRPPTYVIVGEHDEEAIRTVGASLTDPSIASVPARLHLLRNQGHALTGAHERAMADGVKWLTAEIDRAARAHRAATPSTP